MFLQGLTVLMNENQFVCVCVNEWKPIFNNKMFDF